MGLNIFKWLAGKETSPKKVDLSVVCSQLSMQIYMRELAFHMVVNTIANAVSKCELLTYQNNKRIKNEEWYRWNVQPNKNQSAYQFWHKMIETLYENNEVLVIVQNDELYVADNYEYDDSNALFEHEFKNVQIADFTYQRKFKMSEVFYFRLNNCNVKKFLDSTMSMYGKLISAAYSAYITANGIKGFIKVDQYAELQDDFEEQFKKMLNEDFKKFFESENAVMPLYDGYQWEKLEIKGTQTNTRDIRSLFDDVLEMSAIAVGLPPSLITGKVQDTSKAVEEFLTFCIDPLIELLKDEINRKLYDRSKMLKGWYVRFDTKAIKHIDLLEVSQAIDKLISSGCFCINDIRRVCGEDEIDEDWANMYFMTKNYSTIEELLNSLKGGEEDENGNSKAIETNDAAGSEA